MKSIPIDSGFLSCIWEAFAREILEKDFKVATGWGLRVSGRMLIQGTNGGFLQSFQIHDND